MAAAEEQEPFWEDLFDFLREGKLVPVVGPDLLECKNEAGETKNFYTLVAEDLARTVRVAAPERTGLAALNEIACHFLGKSPRPVAEDLYPKVARIVHDREARTEIPRGLLSLARVPSRLFVTTTADRLLVRAIETAQPEWQGRVRTLTYSPMRPQELTKEHLKDGAPIVLHLFGRASATPEFVVTEEDALEFMHALHAETELLGALRHAYLLVVGCGFPDWMARFFLRLGRTRRLREVENKKDWLVDPDRAHPELVAFIANHSPRTQYVPYSTENFVQELDARLPAARKPTSTPAGGRPQMKRGFVFLSYASEDRALVEALHAALSKRIDCWFDGRELEDGVDWARAIAEGVRNCTLFVPVVSPNSLTSEDRYFREEWTQAFQRAPRFPPNRRFLMPLATLDRAFQQHRALDYPELQRPQWHFLDDSTNLDAFVESVVAAYEAAQLPSEMPL